MSEKEVLVKRTITFSYSNPVSSYEGMTEDDIAEYETKMPLAEIVEVLSGLDSDDPVDSGVTVLIQ